MSKHFADNRYSTYQDWKQERRINSAQAMLYEDFLTRAGSDAPKFYAFIDFDCAPRLSLLASTINSLAEQALPLAGFVVFSEEAVPQQAVQLGIDWRSRNAMPAAISAMAKNGAWIIFMQPGSTLDSCCALLLTTAAIEQPNVSALTFDDALSAGLPSETPRFKPHFNIDLLRSYDYVASAVAFRASCLPLSMPTVGKSYRLFTYDALLYLYEHSCATAVRHIPSVLLQRIEQSDNSLALPFKEQANALVRHFERLREAVTVVPGLRDGTCRVVRPVDGEPRVSILIPTRDQIHLLRRCLESLLDRTSYKNIEIIVIDNNSEDPEAVSYLAGLKAMGTDSIRVLPHPYPFNFSEMNNRAAEIATGDYLVFLNNDTAALHGDWLDVMLSHAQRYDVGAVGARLIHDDGTIQHAGVVTGLSGLADHPWFGAPASNDGPLMRLQCEQNYSAVTAACMMVSRKMFLELGGFDAQGLKVLFNDVDLSLRIRETRKLIVWTPFATLIHDGSASLKTKHVERVTAEAKATRAAWERSVMLDRWLPSLASDPYFNPNYSLNDRTVVRDDHPTLNWNPLPWGPIPRIHGAPADFDGCGDYRILAPLSALHSSGKAFCTASTRLYSPIEVVRAAPDTLVVQRQFSRIQLEALSAQRRFSRAFIVFDMDDLYTEIPKGNSARSSFAKLDIENSLPEALRHVHRLIVSTPQLAHAYARYTDDVRVVPNRLPSSRWLGCSSPRHPRKRLRVGWAGGSSHRADLLMFANVIESLKEEVDWVFLGRCPKSLKPHLAEWHPGVSLSDYPEKLAQLDLDLAVAPLKINAFNESKSNIKILEYGAIGYPVICSDITPYQGDYPVTRVKNNDKDWIHAIREHLSDPEELAKRGSKLRNHVVANWMLEDHIEEWLAAWTRE